MWVSIALHAYLEVPCSSTAEPNYRIATASLQSSLNVNDNLI